MTDLVTLEEIEEARVRVTPILRPTPIEVSDSIAKLVGRGISFKPEYRQLTGSYKIRGAYNRISRLARGTEVVAASAGNHAQGVARAAALTGCKATIFMPENAALPKVAATRADGADVRLEGTAVDDAIERAKAYASEHGAVFVPPFDDPLIIAGQGTLGLEVAEGAPHTVVVPIGGGGLISGVAAALKYTRPSVKVIGVQAEGAASMRASLDAGSVKALPSLHTIADGIAVKQPSERTLAHVAKFVDDVVVVTDDEISRALLLLLERAKAVVEPAGAAGLAAVLAGKVPGSDPVLAILSGGNVDPVLLMRLIEHGLSAAGRYLMLNIVIEDRPGALAALTADIAELGLNVLDVEHHRVGLQLGVDSVEVTLTLETRDPEHRDEAVSMLGAKGYTVSRIA